MFQTVETGFDRLAQEYDALWSETAIGTHQRRAVWRWIDPLFQANDYVLDLGCGTGVDALHLQSLGIEMYGLDCSTRMVEIARRRGVDADCREIERLGERGGQFDGAISNFGALNCVRSLPGVASALARVVRSDGYVALCLLGRICLWEIAYFLIQGNRRKAFRRLRGHTKSSLGVDVLYPSKSALLAAFRPYFRLVRFCGIGLFVPPSYVTTLGPEAVAQLAAVDRRLANWPVLRSISDHSLYIFQRL
jgi:ubiquinone/menaquinone biosynthesis C-methylase UbiE